MRGLLLLAMEDFCESYIGVGSWAEVVALSGVSMPSELTPEQDYPDSDWHALFEAVSRLAQKPVTVLQEAFGHHISVGLLEMAINMRVVPEEWTTFDVLEHLESILVTVFRWNWPDAVHPDLRTLRISHGELALVYLSQRRLCHMIRGIVTGLSQFFAEPVEIHEPVCQLQGALLCRFAILSDDPELRRYIDIQREFDVIRQRKDPLTLFNQFKGVPMAASATVVGCNSDQVMVWVARDHLIAMKLEGCTFVSVLHLPVGLYAEVDKVDVQKGVAVLKQVRLADGYLGRRRSPRVMPPEPIKAQLEIEGRSFPARISNLSLGGASLILAPNSTIDHQMLFHTVALAFSLPLQWLEIGDTVELGPQDIHLSGNLLYIDQQPKILKTRVIFAGVAEYEQTLLQHYLQERYQEVLPELQRFAATP
ncbi:MAG: heme NO-binding domain-containing protein [Magnetococcales bacterium]|nr:heme NO-binding domain-containing protein [Magnetococcales bacterium]